MKRTLTAVLIMSSLSLSFSSVAQKYNSSGDLFDGMSRSMPEGRTVYPYGLEVTFDKTTHMIFPAPIRYVDLGSANIVASKVDGAENVLRIKASVRDFETETNLSVICNDGSFFAFNVKYAQEPGKLNIEMTDFLHSSNGNLPTNKADIYFKELGNESPVLVQLVLKTIWQNNKRIVRHIGAGQFGMQFTLKGIYVHNGLLYFHTSLKNRTDMRYQIDYISFKVVDKVSSKQTAIQETLLKPLRAYNNRSLVTPQGELRSVYALESFTLPEGKQLEVTLHEQNGGRTLTYILENDEIIRAKNIDNLQLKF